MALRALEESLPATKGKISSGRLLKENGSGPILADFIACSSAVSLPAFLFIAKVIQSRMATINALIFQNRNHRGQIEILKKRTIIVDRRIMCLSTKPYITIVLGHTKSKLDKHVFYGHVRDSKQSLIG